MKKTRLFFLSFVMVTSITLLSGCGKDKTDDVTEDVTTTSAISLETMTTETTAVTMSDEELLERFGSIIELEVEKQLAAATTEQTSAPVVEETVESTTETTAEADALGEDSDSDVNTSLIEATLLHRNSEYSLCVEAGLYEAAFRSRFLGKGRSLEILLDTNCNIDTISVHEAFNDGNDFLQFEQINKVDFSETSSGYSFSYEIPDNPSGEGYHARTNFCAVFEIVDSDGNSYYTSISY